ncbi:phage tail protein [Streptomyces anulatus]|uniref:phage tail protein n=1 Tax=Streptomyces anulatus TaxID=1892 RepID=UPI003642723A
MAGNGAVSRLVAQRYTAPVKTPPAQSARFRTMKADVAGKKTRLAAHAPAAAESKASQDAAMAPPDDKEAQGKAANAEKMNAAKPGEFDKKAFIDAVNKAIDSQAPKNLDEADKFAKSGKADQVKAEVDGKVTDGKESSAKDIDTATKAPPDTSAAKDKDVTPLTPDAAPGNPGAPSATDAVPEKQPAAVTDFSEGPAENDKTMADAEVTEEQLAKGNEPEFNEALSAKKTSEADAAKAPAKGKAAEDQQLSNAKENAAASGAQAMAGLTSTRAAAGKQVDGGKNDTKSKDEKKRAEVTAKLQKVYDGTKKDVEDTLSGLDKKVDSAFTSGEKSARDAFTADHKSRMKKYKDKRYSGLMGKGRWIKDKFAGLPKAANDLYQESRKLYVSKMQTVISSVADIIGAELGKAKARIAKGRTELKAEVDKLPADLKQFGEEAAKDFAGKFDDLEATVNEKSEQLVQDLAQKYTAALNKIDEEIKKLQEANKGLIDKAKDAIVGAIKTINELKNLLLGILAKAASAIMKIIKDPIGFLGNLVKAVGAGLNLFITNIADHLKTGVVSWLLGTAVKAGLDLPAKFDLKGIIQLIGSMLGLTWDNIRTRVTRKGVPDEAMSAVETSVPVAKNLAAEGPAGAVKEIQAEAGDLKATILSKLTTYLIPTVLIAGITWIVSLLNPASAFVRAVKGIIDIVTFIVTQGAQIADFVNAVLDAVIAIANGGQAGVPKLIEAALASSVPLLIGFLAALLGIGGLANKVKSVFQSVSRPVTRAIDKIVDFIAKKGKALWAKLRNKNGDNKGKSNQKGDKTENTKGYPRTVRIPFQMQGKQHHLIFTPPNRILMASTPEQIHEKTSATIAALRESESDDKSGRTTAKIAELEYIAGLAETATIAIELFTGKEHESDLRKALDDLRLACIIYGKHANVKDIDPEAESKENTEKRWRETVDRAKHIAPRNYADGKHWKGTNDVERRSASTPKKPGQFIYSIKEPHVKELERDTLLNGDRVYQGGGTFHAFKEFDQQIGWANDEKAHWMRAEITDVDPDFPEDSKKVGSIHSHPRLTREG